MARMSQERLSTLLGLSAVLLWSTVATAFKLSLEHFSPAQLLWLASLISAAVFWTAAMATGTWRLARPDLAWAALLGAINPLAYYLVLFEAYDRLPAQIAQPLNYTWAIVLALLAVPILKQRLSSRTLAGIVIAYLGVVVLLYRDGDTAGISPSGIGLALASTVLWAVYWLLNTRTDAPPIGLMAWSFSFALPPLTWWMWLADGWPDALATGWPYALWVGLVEMGVTFLLWQQALKRTNNVARISQLIFLSPFLSLLLIGSVLGESVRATTIIGLFIIVTGVVLTQRGARTLDQPSGS